VSARNFGRGFSRRYNLMARPLLHTPGGFRGDDRVFEILFDDARDARSGGETYPAEDMTSWPGARVWGM
jgi:hypothetical protein